MDQPLAWYAVYTKSRFEKRLAGLLGEKGIEAYVPLRKVLRQWSDRKKLVDEPLIRSYCFVNIAPDRYTDVLHTPGAVRFVFFGGKPAAIPARQIDTLKAVTGSNVEVDAISLKGIKPGRLVRVTAGPLSGITGEILRVGAANKVVIRIEHLSQGLILSISPLLLEPVSM